jgi:predicted PurR-regulated permease PerM
MCLNYLLYFSEVINIALKKLQPINLVYNTGMDIRIDIDTKTFVRFWLVVIGFALAAFAIYSARTALIIIGAAAFLAVALNPPVNRLAKIFPSKSRLLGTALAYIAVVLVLIAIAFLVVPPIVEQTVKFAQNVPDLVDTASQQYAGVNEFVDRYDLRPVVDKAVASIKSDATKFASKAGSILISGIGSIMSVLTAGILTFVLAFLMLLEGPTWLDRMWGLYSNQHRMRHHRRILSRMGNVINNYVTGQLTISAIAGLVAGMVVFILSLAFNIPSNLAIPTAAIVLISSLIPLFGATIGAISVSFVILLNNVTAAVIFFIFFLIYQQIEANFISPKIQSKRIDLSPLSILVAVTIGIYLFGIVGGIISIPIAGCIRVVAEDYIVRIKEGRAKSEKTPPHKKEVRIKG